LGKLLFYCAAKGGGMMGAIFRWVLFLSFLLLLNGCGTIASLEGNRAGAPKIYSGTRLDLRAMQGDQVAREQLKGKMPPIPVVCDLPASLLLDTVVLPGTLGIAAYEALFY